jgi:hypothetical protein
MGIRNRFQTKEQLIKAYRLKIGDSICQVGDDGEYLGAIEDFQLVEKKLGNLLRVVVNGVSYSVLDITWCPSPAEIRAKGDEILTLHEVTLPSAIVDLS